MTVELDHLLTVFYSRQEFFGLLSRHPNTMPNLHGIEFQTLIECCNGLHVMVKNCGYRWVFKEDLQQFNSHVFQHKFYISKEEASRK